MTILLEELSEAYPAFEYDAWLTRINGEQFGSSFVGVNPNSKIPAMLHYRGGAGGGEPVRLFESGSILLYLCEAFDPRGLFMPQDARLKAECVNWLMWQMGSAPYVGGGFGHFFNYAPIKIEYAIDRFSMETKRLLDVLERHLGGKDGKGHNGTAGGPFMLGEAYSIADMAIWPWYGNLALGRLYGNSETFLSVKQDYPHVIAWAQRVLERPGVARGRMVNRTWGGKDEQLHDRHSRADFATETEAAKAARFDAAVAAAEVREAGAAAVLTAERPGEWKGKEGKHVPAMTAASKGGAGGGSPSDKDVSAVAVTVTVPHSMDAEHFIELIWAKDQDGRVVAAKQLAPGDAPSLTFTAPAGTTSVTAFESCNLHGVWASGTVLL